MRYLNNDKGVALVTALMLTLISLTIIMTVLYLLTQGTRLTASQKRYQNSLEAAYGGVEFFGKEILPRLITPAIDQTMTSAVLTDIQNDYPITVSLPSTASNISCLQQKLSLPFGSWTNCASANKTSSPKDSPDMTFTLPGPLGQSGFNVYAKVVDTQSGNTDTSGLELVVGGNVAAGSNAVINPGQQVPYMYTLELQGEKEVSPEERARLSVLYAY
ncbi:MAG: pilus assembly protein PilX [Desulfuromonadales bacterium]|nr:MAG: pilus assembly protein PilX [Desulfuromonadales bacterium]